KPAKAAGPRKLAARPVMAYNPNSSPSRPAGVNRPRNVREADWAGPTNNASNRPPIQNAVGPDDTDSTTPTTRRQVSAPTITSFGPASSSIRPAAIAPAAATKFAA